MAALPQLMSVEQFRQLPEGEYQYELHHGEVVAMTRPKAWHSELQHRLLMLLGPRLATFGQVRIEYAYRPLPEFELRAADVAAISRPRWEAMDLDDNLRGSPDLVIEVKSPSNSGRQLPELASFCLNNGALEFWIIDAKKIRDGISPRRCSGGV